MSVDQSNVVDFASINLSGEVELTISDHLKWDDKNELLLNLQNKLNSYLEFIENGELYEKYPKATGRKIVISIMAKYEPNHTATVFLERVKDLVESSGYGFSFKVSKDGKW